MPPPPRPPAPPRLVDFDDPSETSEAEADTTAPGSARAVPAPITTTGAPIVTGTRKAVPEPVPGPSGTQPDLDAEEVAAVAAHLDAIRAAVGPSADDSRTDTAVQALRPHDDDSDVDTSPSVRALQVAQQAPVPVDVGGGDDGGDTGGATDPSLVIPGQSGELGAGKGARLLMDLFVHERTGRLIVEMPSSRGTLFFLAGEPVHAATEGADLALAKRLEEKGALDDAARAKLKAAQKAATSMSTGSMPSVLVKERLSKPVPILEALRDHVRDFTKQIVDAPGGAWRFFDDTEFAEHTVLTAVNPFGLVLDSRRRASTPDALLRDGEEIAMKTPGPLPGFANVAARLRAFTGQVDISNVVDGTLLAGRIYEVIRLDPLTGGLVLGALHDSGLVEFLPGRRTEAVIEKRTSPTSALPVLVQDAHLSMLAQMPGRGANELLALYLELKPERDDDAILGVDVEATPTAIERGYQARLAELDPRAVPSGRVRPYLLGRAEELRSKVERAYRRRTAGLGKRGGDAYEILERIGVGGMAEVFRGRLAGDVGGVGGDDPGRLVAIKRILPSHRGDPDYARQFLEEARLARRVQHPNVVRVFTVGKAGDDLYLAMEFVDGCDLGELLRRSKKLRRNVPIDVACRIIADACGGLHAAHTAHDRDGNIVPILHRDVSPQNLLISANGDVKLSDFGIARTANITQTGEEDSGMVKGKAGFLPPEVVDGRKHTVRSDVYSMAMTFYTVVAARTPFLRDDVLETLRAVLCDDLPALSSLRPDVPRELDGMFLRAGARAPEERHGSAQELQLELEEFLAGRPPVDVATWAKGLGSEKKASVSPPLLITQTVPIAEDVDVDDL